MRTGFGAVVLLLIIVAIVASDDAALEAIDSIYGLMLVFNFPFPVWIAGILVVAAIWYWAWRVHRHYRPKPLPKLPDGWKD